MHRIRILVLTLVAVAAFASLASAHAATPRVDARQASQKARIAHGVANGSLTAAEAARLRAGQRQIRRVERRAKADGHVGPVERARLERLQDRESRAIARRTHDARTR